MKRAKIIALLSFLLFGQSLFALKVGILHPSENEGLELFYREFLNAYHRHYPQMTPIYVNIQKISPTQLYRTVITLTQRGTEAFLGPYFSSEASVVLRALQNFPVPVLTFYATDTSLFYQSPYFFSLSFSNAALAKKMAEVIKTQKKSRVSVVYSQLDRYSSNLVFWLRRFLFQIPGIELKMINLHEKTKEINPFSFLHDLIVSPGVVAYIFSNPKHYETLAWYLKQKKDQLRASFLLPDGLEFYEKEKDFSGLAGQWWLTYFQPEKLLPSWAQSFVQRNPDAYDLVFLYAGLEILRQGEEKKAASGRTWIEILEKDAFWVEGKEFRFDSFHFRNLPVSLYQILSGEKIQKVW